MPNGYPNLAESVFAWPARSPETKLPRLLTIGVLLLCAAPFIANQFGIDFSMSTTAISSAEAKRVAAEADLLAAPKPPNPKAIPLRLSGLFVFLMFQWVGVTLALVTGAASLLHYSLRRNVTTPLLGAVLIFTGFLDAFQTLASTGVIVSEGDQELFVEFTWSLSRIFHAASLCAGVLFAMVGGRFAAPDMILRRGWGMLMIGVIFAAGAYSIVLICARQPILPQGLFPQSQVCRPWDAYSLIGYVILGAVLLPLLRRKHPSLFAQGLQLSAVPLILGQCLSAFYSTEQFDNAFNISQFLKLLGYLVPLAALLTDYVRAYKAEAVLIATEATLEVARDIQRALQPDAPPALAGFEIHGFSTSSGSVGGDYFDYLPLANGHTGVVVADVSGHDVGASILMAQTRAFLRATSLHSGNLPQLMSNLNNFLLNDVRDRRFVSLFCVSLDPVSKASDYIGAGQTAFRLRPGQTPVPLEISSPLLGIMEDPVKEGVSFSLEPGEMLVIVTDGIPESTNPKKEMFGNDRLFHIISTQFEKPLPEVCQSVLAATFEFCGQTPPTDDLTMVIVKRRL